MSGGKKPTRDEVLARIAEELSTWRALPQEEKDRLADEQHRRVSDALRRHESQVLRNNGDYLRRKFHTDRRVDR